MYCYLGQRFCAGMCFWWLRACGPLQKRTVHPPCGTVTCDSSVPNCTNSVTWSRHAATAKTPHPTQAPSPRP